MIKLSPSSLNFFRSCPLCFWLSFNREINPPGGIIASITNGLDNVIKRYVNNYRPYGKMPPWFAGKIPGKLIDILPTTLRCEIDGNILSGRLDECIVLEDGTCSPLDYKSKGFAPKEEVEIYEDTKLQMDCYALLLDKNGHKTSGIGYIAYYYPDHGELHNGFPFNLHVVKIKVNPQNAIDIFREAVKCLQGHEPEPSKECILCEYVRNRK